MCNEAARADPVSTFPTPRPPRPRTENGRGWAPPVFRAPPATLQQQGRLWQLVQDTLHSRDLDALPFFDAAKVRTLLKQLPTLSAQEQGLLDPMLMELTSLCLLQRRYRMSGQSWNTLNEVAA